MTAKMLAIALFAATACTGAAYARGGGAEPMPMTNFTDLPDYRPKPLTRCQHSKRVCDHTRWHQSIYRSN
jgi:hypothetical protein